MTLSRRQLSPRSRTALSRRIPALLCLTLSLFTVEAGASVARSSRAAVAAPSRFATQTALQVMMDGGNAADAAIAAAFVTGVTSPHSAGPGGGGFLVYYEKSSETYWTLDFREAAPMMLPSAKNPSPAASVAVPGFVGGMESFRARFGSKPWSFLLQPAVRVATEGSLGADLAGALAEKSGELATSGAASAFTAEGGAPLQRGAPLKLTALSATLSRLASRGAADFYDGAEARALVKQLRAAGSTLTLRDFAQYRAKWRAPIRLESGELTIVAPPPPSAGIAIIGQVLGLIPKLPAAPDSEASIHLLAECTRRAFLGQAPAVGDPDRAQFAMLGLFAPTRLDALVKDIEAERATPTADLPGEAMTEADERGASLSVVDANGNIAALSFALGDSFGSGILADGGYFLNSAMRSFSTATGGHANALEPGKRPRSFLTPLIVLRKGKPYMAIGSDGGAPTPGTLLQVILSTARGTPPSEAVVAPRFHQGALPDEILLEKKLASHATVARLTGFGHPVKSCDSIGNVQAIVIEDGRLTALADPRHEGVAGGF
jgi:gamma-glutamyltranspeptidase/glutathione hydrolase